MNRCSVTKSKGESKNVKEEIVTEPKGRGSRRAKAEDDAVEEKGAVKRAKENVVVGEKGGGKRSKESTAVEENGVVKNVTENGVVGEKGGGKRSKEFTAVEEKTRTKRAKVNNGRSVSRVEAPRQPKAEKGGKGKPPRQPKEEKGANGRASGQLKGAEKEAKKAPGKARKRGKAPAIDDDMIQVKQAPLADSEEAAIVLTHPSDPAAAAAAAAEKKTPVRQLLDFVFHDADGALMPLDSFDALAARGEGLFATAVILPETAALRHMEGYRCEAFGPIDGWYIDGYEKANTAARIMITTDAATYVCCRPAAKQKKDFTPLQGLSKPGGGEPTLSLPKVVARASSSYPVPPHSRFPPPSKQDKANLCVEVFRALSKPDGGDPTISLPEVVARVSRALGRPCRDDLVAAHAFVAQQLCGLDEDADEDDQLFSGLPALESLKEEGAKHAAVRSIVEARQASAKEHTGKNPAATNGALVIRDTAGGSGSSSRAGEGASVGIDDEELARLVAEEEEKEAEAKRGGGRRKGAGGGGRQERYLKINEKELADDYPPPRYYKSVDEETDEFLFDDPLLTAVPSSSPAPSPFPHSRPSPSPLPSWQLLFQSVDEETDEFLLFDDATAPLYPDDLPRRRLDDWALYDDQLRFVPLELLPMLPGVAADSLVFGSGVMMEDDGSGFSLDDPTVESAGTTRGDGAGGSSGGTSGGSSGASGSGSGSGSDPAAADGGDGGAGGIRVYLSAIKEWMIEFGAGMLFVTIRTDGAWYRLGRPCSAYVPWYRPVLRTARLAIRVIEMLSGESRAARLSFLDVVTKLAQERVAEKQQKSGKQFREYPVETIRRSPFISTLREKMEMRSHTELKVSMKKAAMIVASRGSNGRGGGDGGSARNANPAAALRPDASKRKPMRATTTQLVHRIWKEYYERFGLKRDEVGAGKGGGEGEENGKVEGEEVEDEEEGGELKDGDSEDEEEEVEEVAGARQTKGRKTKGIIAKSAELDKEAGVTDKGKAAVAGGEAKKGKEAVAGGCKARAVKDSTQGVTWMGASTGRTEEDHPAYAAASVWGLEVKAGIVVLAAVAEGEDDGDEGRWREEEERLVLVEYMWDEGGVGGGAGRRRRGEGMKAHGRVMVRGSETVLGNAADEWELFVSEHCVDFPLTAIRELAPVTHRKQPWGVEHRLRNMEEHERERERMEKIFKETGQRSFFYRLLYNPSRGGFFDLPKSLGSGTGRCCSCDEDTERDRMMEVRRLGDGEEGFAYLGKEFRVQDFVFLHPAAVGEESEGKKFKIAKGGRNIGLRAWPIGQIEKFVAPTGGAKEVPEKMVVRRFFRPEDVPNEGDEIAYTAHIREVYYSETLITVDVTDVIGKCRVQRGKPTAATAATGTEADHSGFNIGGLPGGGADGRRLSLSLPVLEGNTCHQKYEILPPGIRFGPSSAAAAASPIKDKGKGKGKSVAADDDADAEAAAIEAAAVARARAKGKGKAAAEEPDEPTSKAAAGANKQEKKQEKQEEKENKGKQEEGQQGVGNSSKGGTGVLRTLDIFAGCGGLSEGLQRSRACETRWAIEYEHPAAEAFQKNHPDAAVICANCNVVLRSMMEQAGQLGDCVSTPEADEAAAKMAEGEKGKLPLPGQVDFVNGGPPCQAERGKLPLPGQVDFVNGGPPCQVSRPQVAPTPPALVVRVGQTAEAESGELLLPGQVEFVNGGPPCQGFSGMNRFNQNPWSKVQCEMILAFLSFADFLRPNYFLLENVRNFVSFNGARTFRLALRTLLAMGYQNVRNFVSLIGARSFRLALRTLRAMGYQVRFGVLQAGNFGISQSRTRAFIWAAAPGHVLPEWPQPLHVFASSQLSVPLTTSAAGGASAASGAAGGAASIGHFSTASSLANEACPRGPAVGAPLRSITVRDAMGDLPSIENGAEEEEMEVSHRVGVVSGECGILVSGFKKPQNPSASQHSPSLPPSPFTSTYSSEPSSWFQRSIRAQQARLLDHTCKRMNELNLKRCQHIPRRPGADWRDLPDIKVRLSDGREADLVPWCLPNTMERHNNWKGLFGRLDWAGNFPTSVTDPQPMGKVGMCFHPEQDRIVSVRECARSQGFPDWYRFAGNIQAKHRQIGNAVPPPLALALGLQLRKALLETRKINGAEVEREGKDEAK
ncbi:unnamed protein product [Closterium sp. NIES-64]|nr:unnamed protein product [Closterium sp. NIES-64]